MIYIFCWKKKKSKFLLSVLCIVYNELLVMIKMSRWHANYILKIVCTIENFSAKDPTTSFRVVYYFFQVLWKVIPLFSWISPVSFLLTFCQQDSPWSFNLRCTQTSPSVTLALPLEHRSSRNAKSKIWQAADR